MASANLSGLRWRKSSRSNTKGNCVEVAFADQAVMTRDSKHRDGAALVFSPSDWTSFLEAVRTDRFEA